MNLEIHIKEIKIKSIEDYDEARKFIIEGLNNNSFSITISVSESKEEVESRLIKRLSEIVDSMELYYSKKCNEFDKKHIINYVKKIHGSYITAEYMKKLFELRGLKY